MYDLWLVDLAEDMARPDNKYDSSKLPHLNPKQIYDMVNTMTNRRPVKISENDSIFGNFDLVPNRIDRLYTSNNRPAQYNGTNEVLFVKQNQKSNPNKSSSHNNTNIKRLAVQIKTQDPVGKQPNGFEPENTLVSVHSLNNDETQMQNQSNKQESNAIANDSENNVIIKVFSFLNPIYRKFFFL